MTDEAKALVERLRDDLPQTLIEKHWVDDHDAIYKQREEAADLIETQAREIERLRGELQEIIAYSQKHIDDTDAYTMSRHKIQASRAALAGDSHVAD